MKKMPDKLRTDLYSLIAYGVIYTAAVVAWITMLIIYKWMPIYTIMPLGVGAIGMEHEIKKHTKSIQDQLNSTQWPGFEPLIEKSKALHWLTLIGGGLVYIWWVWKVRDEWAKYKAL